MVNFHDPDYFIKKDYMSFIHIPKSGGTTFSKLVEKYNLKIDNINCHVPISKNCNTDEYKYVLILRNPVERCFSYFNFVRSRGPGYPYNNFSNDIKLFFEKSPEVNNFLTQYMACINPLKNIKVDDEIFEIAKKNIDKIYKIILFDNFEENLKLFFKTDFNIKLNKISNLRNYHYDKKINNENLEIIKEKNKYDIMLYNYIKKRI